MSSDKELYKKKPRLYRVACELSKFDDPYKALELMLALAGPIMRKNPLPGDMEVVNHENEV